MVFLLGQRVVHILRPTLGKKKLQALGILWVKCVLERTVHSTTFPASRQWGVC